MKQFKGALPLLTNTVQTGAQFDIPVYAKFWEDRRFTISILSMKFPQVSRYFTKNVQKVKFRNWSLDGLWNSLLRIPNKQNWTVDQIFYSLGWRRLWNNKTNHRRWNMVVLYHSLIKAYGIATHCFSYQGQRQTLTRFKIVAVF